MVNTDEIYEHIYNNISFESMDVSNINHIVIDLIAIFLTSKKDDYHTIQQSVFYPEKVGEKWLRNVIEYRRNDNNVTYVSQNYIDIKYDDLLNYSRINKLKNVFKKDELNK